MLLHQLLNNNNMSHIPTSLQQLLHGWHTVMNTGTSYIRNVRDTGRRGVERSDSKLTTRCWVVDTRQPAPTTVPMRCIASLRLCIYLWCSSTVVHSCSSGLSYAHFPSVVCRQWRSCCSCSASQAVNVRPVANKLPKDNFDELAQFLVELFNWSLAPGVVPSIFKSAYITPLLDRGGPTMCNSKLRKSRFCGVCRLVAAPDSRRLNDGGLVYHSPATCHGSCIMLLSSHMLHLQRQSVHQSINRTVDWLVFYGTST